jgi:hypothetical protein
MKAGRLHRLPLLELYAFRLLINGVLGAERSSRRRPPFDL